MGEERDEDGWKGGGWEGRERREMRMGRRRTRRRREERRKGIKEEGRRKRRAKTKRDVSSSFSSVVQCSTACTTRQKLTPFTIVLLSLPRCRTSIKG